MTAPRLFGIVATQAPVVAVLRRGPSDWSAIGRWDLDGPTYEQGAWLHGTLYPQRCDLSPDGRWLSYFVLKKRADWDAGGSYIAVSRLPWATALAAWPTCGTWTRGYHFVEDPRCWEVGDPTEGEAGPLRERYGLAWTRAASYAVERRRGWVETPDSPPAREDDPWDERRADAVRMSKPSPADPSVALVVGGRYAAHRSMTPEPPRYVLARGSDVVPAPHADARTLDDVQWADWAPDGRLLVATADGRLQVRTSDARDVTWETDLSVLTPDPTPPPDAARHW